MKFVAFSATNESEAPAPPPTSSYPLAEKAPTGTTVPASVVALVAANLLPLFGALFWQWSVFSILLLYWLESGVIGLYNIPKVVKIGGWRALGEALRVLIFFGLFLGAELLTLLLYFSGPKPVPSGELPPLDPIYNSLDEILIALPVLVVSHGISFFKNFIGKKEFLATTLAQQTRAPWNRVMFLHVALGIGTALAVKLGSPLYALLLFVVLKIIVDAFAHVREHTVSFGRGRFRMMIARM